MKIHMQIQERLDKRVCSSVLLFESAFMTTAQALLKISLSHGASVPVVSA
ncbi:hypothetical protein Tsp_10431, partial [Trichinella spiralis]